jgi:hypothetical protein
MRIIRAWQSISPEVTVKGFKKCCISITADGTDDNMLWNGSEGDGNVKSMRKMSALTVQMELVTLTCFEYARAHTHTHTRVSQQLSALYVSYLEKQEQRSYNYIIFQHSPLALQCTFTITAQSAL